jgi:phospholipid/cholesterol/gamma-HCH transport system substrate-binding protein
LTRIAAVAGVAILLFALLLAIFRSDGSYEARAVFEDVRGLIPGGEVKAGAHDVGRVEDIEFDDQGLPVVTMSIDDDFDLRQGAFANIRLASNVGGVNRYIDLEQGEGPELGDGATLGPAQTDQPVDLDVAFSELKPKVRAEVASVIAGVDAAVKGRGDDLDVALRHSATALGETADLLAEVNGDRFALRTLVREGRVVVGALARGPGDLGSTAENLATALRVAGGRQLELRRAVNAIGPGVRSARGAFERLLEAIPNIRELIGASGPAVDELVPTAREIRPAIAALRPLLAEASVLIDRAPGQLRRIKPVLRAALPVIERLDPILDGVGPLLDYLRTWAPEAVNFFTLGGDATSSYDANGNLIRSTAIPIPAPRPSTTLAGVIGPGENGPGRVCRPFARTPGSLEGPSEAFNDYADFFVGGAEPPQSFLEPDEQFAGEECP